MKKIVTFNLRNSSKDYSEFYRLIDSFSGVYITETTCLLKTDSNCLNLVQQFISVMDINDSICVIDALHYWATEKCYKK